MTQPNLIARLENLIAALDEVSGMSSADDQRIDDAAGIAGEILTMVDGR